MTTQPVPSTMPQGKPPTQTTIKNVVVNDNDTTENTSTTMAVTMLPIDSVRVGEGRRTLRDVSELAASIAETRLLNPITVTTDKLLVAGLHRLEACRKLGWTEIPAIEITLDDLDRQLAEIDENLVRFDLTVLERAEHLAKRKQLYLAKHPETARGVAGALAKHGSASEMISFAGDTSAKIGVSRRTVEQEVQIAEAIPEDVRDALRGTAIEDSKTELLKLARMDEAHQHRVAEQVAAGAKSVSEANGGAAEPTAPAAEVHTPNPCHPSIAPQIAKLTSIAKRAAQARRTGLARSMAESLTKIENEIRTTREEIRAEWKNREALYKEQIGGLVARRAQS